MQMVDKSLLRHWVKSFEAVRQTELILVENAAADFDQGHDNPPLPKEVMQAVGEAIT